MGGSRTQSMAWRVMLALVLAYTPTALSQAQRDSPVQTGPIIAAGRIVTGDTEMPLPRVRVSVPGDDAVPPQFTDQDGRFQIILPAGTSGLRLAKPGFAPLSVERRSLRTGTQVMVRMARGGAIMGMVTDSLGAPAVNMSVRVRRVNEGGSSQSGNSQYSAETDDQGEFRVGNLPAGRYTVTPGGRGGRGPGGGALVDLLGGSRGDELRTLLQGIDQEQLRIVADSLGLQQELEFLGRGGRPDEDFFGRGGNPDGNNFGGGNNAGGNQNGNRGGGGNRGANQNAQGQPAQSGQAQGQPPQSGQQGQQGQTQTQAQNAQAQQQQSRGNRGRGRGGDTGARGNTPTDTGPPLPTVDVAAGQEATMSLTIDDQGAAVLEQALRLAAAASTTTRTPATNADGTPAPTGEVRGRIYSADGLPLKGASVQLNPVGGTGSRRSAVTDDAGRYEVTGITPGSYRARISKSGLPAVEFGQKRTLQPGRIITVAAKQRVQGIDVKMPRSSVVTGRLTDQWGEPIEGARLEVLESTFVEGRTTLASVSGVRSRRTDDRGQYRLYGLLPGTYYVVASEQNGDGERGPDGDGGTARVFYPGTMSAVAATPVEVDAGQDAFGLDFTFAPIRASQVQGLAVSSNGEVARGRAILAVSERSGEPLLPLQSARIEEDGTFVFNGVASGEYVVQVLSNVPQDNRNNGRGGNRGRGGNDNGGRGGGQQTNNQGRGGGGRGGGNTPTPQGATTGRAAAAGTTTQSQSGAAGQVNAGGGQRGGNAGQQQGRGQTGGNQQTNGGRGRASATGTPARNIQRSDREFGVAYVTVNEAEIATVRVDTVPGTPVTGQILLEGDTSTTLNASSFGFTAHGVNGDMSPLSGTRQFNAQVQNDWTFVIMDLMGASRFSQSRAPDGWYLKSAMVNGQNAVEEPVAFDTGSQSVVEVTVTFASGAASLEGRVLDDRRQPTGEFGVVVFSSDPDRWFNRSPYLKFATPNQDGTYSITGLPPAEYLVAALDRVDGGPDFGEWQNPNVLSSLAPTAKRVKLGAGEVVSAELRMMKIAR